MSDWTDAEASARRLTDELCLRQDIESAIFQSTGRDNPPFITKLNQQLDFYAFLNEVGRAELK